MAGPELVLGPDGKLYPITRRQIAARAALGVFQHPLGGLETLDWLVADAVLAALDKVEPIVQWQWQLEGHDNCWTPCVAPDAEELKGPDAHRFRPLYARVP